MLLRIKLDSFGHHTYTFTTEKDFVGEKRVATRPRWNNFSGSLAQ